MPEMLRKVCGLTRPEDVALCHELGADFIGCIFADKSPRRLSPQEAAALPDGPARRVGVFAGADPATVRQTARQARLDLIQLHGGEDPDFCRAVGPERIIKTLWPERLSQENLARELERFAPVCAFFLLDAGLGGGGNGRSLTWDRLRHILFPKPWFLAGGLGPKTLLPALAACSPDGVDCNSALESTPGVKDHALLRKAFDIITDHSGFAAGHIPERLS